METDILVDPRDSVFGVNYPFLAVNLISLSTDSISDSPLPARIVFLC